MRATRNRVYGNTVTGVQIPPHPPFYFNRLFEAFFYADEPLQTALKACFQRTGLFTLASNFASKACAILAQ